MSIPTTYDDNDPVASIFELITSADRRSTAWRLLARNQIGELEILLEEEGILLSDGTFDTDRYPEIDWSRPEDMQGDEVQIASLNVETPEVSAMNYAYVQRRGWNWIFWASLDGVKQALGSNTMPVSANGLVSMLGQTDLVPFLEESNSGYRFAWQSDIYPDL
jgi:hypothetical protein